VFYEGIKTVVMDMEDGKVEVEKKESSESLWLKRWKLAAILFLAL